MGVLLEQPQYLKMTYIEVVVVWAWGCVQQRQQQQVRGKSFKATKK